MKEITSIVNVIVIERYDNTIVSNTVVVNDEQLAEIIFENECRDHFTEELESSVIKKALENGYMKGDRKSVYINHPEQKIVGLKEVS